MLLIHSKAEAVRLFGSQAKLARAVGVTRGAVWQWPEELPRRLSDQVLGAAVRHGLFTGNDLMPTNQENDSTPATPPPPRADSAGMEAGGCS